VGTGVRTTVGELLEHICALVPGSSYRIQGTTPGDQSGIYADVTEVRSYLGTDSYIPLEAGLRTFLDWARTQTIVS